MLFFVLSNTRSFRRPWDAFGSYLLLPLSRTYPIGKAWHLRVIGIAGATTLGNDYPFGREL